MDGGGAGGGAGGLPARQLSVRAHLPGRRRRLCGRSDGRRGGGHADRAQSRDLGMGGGGGPGLPRPGDAVLDRPQGDPEGPQPVPAGRDAPAPPALSPPRRPARTQAQSRTGGQPGDRRDHVGRRTDGPLLRHGVSPYRPVGGPVPRAAVRALSRRLLPAPPAAARPCRGVSPRAANGRTGPGRDAFPGNQRIPHRESPEWPHGPAAAGDPLARHASPRAVLRRPPA